MWNIFLPKCSHIYAKNYVRPCSEKIFTWIFLLMINVSAWNFSSAHSDILISLNWIRKEQGFLVGYSSNHWCFNELWVPQESGSRLALHYHRHRQMAIILSFSVAITIVYLSTQLSMVASIRYSYKPTISPCWLINTMTT